MGCNNSKNVVQPVGRPSSATVSLDTTPRNIHGDDDQVNLITCRLSAVCCDQVNETDIDQSSGISSTETRCSICPTFLYDDANRRAI